MFSFNVFIQAALSRWQNHYCGWQSSRRNLSTTGWTIADANTLHKSTFQLCSWCQHIRYIWSWSVIKKETIKQTFHKQMTRGLFKTGTRICRVQRKKNTLHELFTHIQHVYQLPLHNEHKGDNQISCDTKLCNSLCGRFVFQKLATPLLICQCSS